MADDARRRKGRAPKRKTTATRPKRRSSAPRAKTPEPRAADRFVEEPILADTRAIVDLLDRGGAGPRGGPESDTHTSRPLDKACQRLMELVRQHCPGLLPPDPLKRGDVAPPIPVQPKEMTALVTLAARQAVLEAAGAQVPTEPERLPSSVLWQEGPDALLVEVARIEVRMADGLVSIAIPVRCDQLPRGRDIVEVDLVFGTPDRPAGLLAAATEPRGPRVVVRRWGDALTALAWQAVLDSIGGVAAAAGIDRDGARLIPTALTATANGLAVLAQARHEMDRVRPGRVVRPPQSTGMSRP